MTTQYVNKFHPLSRALYILDKSEKELYAERRKVSKSHRDQFNKGLEVIDHVRYYLALEHGRAQGAWI